MLPPIKILTKMSPEHRNFILKAMLNTSRHSKYSEAILADHYFDGESKIILKLLEVCEFKIAVNIEDEYQIYSFVLFNSNEDYPIIHYAFTKLPYRKMGIINELTKEFGDSKIIHTYDTKSFTRIFKKSKKIYNPYIRYSL